MPRRKKQEHEKSVPFQPKPVGEDVEFEQGEIVWAKLKGFPPWPAIVAQYSDSQHSSESDEETQANANSKMTGLQTHQEGQQLKEQAPMKRKSKNASQQKSEGERLIWKRQDRECCKSVNNCSALTEERLLVNFIGDKSYGNIPISRIQKWEEFFEIYSRNQKPKLQKAIKEAKRILNGEIGYSGRLRITTDHLAEIEMTDQEEEKQIEKNQPKLKRGKGQQRIKRKYKRRKPYTQRKKLYRYESESQYEYESESEDIHEIKRSRNLRSTHFTPEIQHLQAEQKPKRRERSRSAQKETPHLQEIKVFKKSFEQFINLNEDMNELFLNPIQDSLRRLSKIEVTIEIMMKSEIGISVQKMYEYLGNLKHKYTNDLVNYNKKYDSIIALSLSLLCEWRFLVDRHFFSASVSSERFKFVSENREQNTRQGLTYAGNLGQSAALANENFQSRSVAHTSRIVLPQARGGDIFRRPQNSAFKAFYPPNN